MLLKYDFFKKNSKKEYKTIATIENRRIGAKYIF